MTATEVLVPIKAFTHAKQRLSPSVEPEDRIRLVKKMGANVLAATNGFVTWAVCDDEDVATWADDAGFAVLFQPATGLNEAIQLSVSHRQDHGVKRIIVAHADLPLLSNVKPLVDVTGVVAVPDHTGLGTKLLTIPTSCGFRFRYGAYSADAHRAEAERCGLAFKTIDHPEMGFDINTAEDLQRLANDYPTTFDDLTKDISISYRRFEPL